MLTLKEIQSIELEIMKELHNWCVKHKIRYCMGYGTLLGAVRHQGFIPWDNDMDILMPRPDFERMLELTKTYPISDHIRILHYTRDKKYHYSVARACDIRTKVFAPYLVEQPDNLGIWVDIFPVDGIPEKKQRLNVRLCSWFLKKLQRVDLYNSKNLVLVKNIKFILRFIFPNRNNIHMLKIDRFAKKCPFEGSVYVGDMVEILPISLKRIEFEESILLKFEDAEFYAPKYWDEYLKKSYGNYMVLPPEEKRMTHDIIATWRSEE